MLRSTTFIAPYRCFKKGVVLEFRPGLNLLVGDQGTGKSTILSLIANNQDNKETVEIDADEGAFRFFDTEKDNPRHKRYVETAFDVQCRFKSHGEIMLLIGEALEQLLAADNAAPTLFLYDELESGLSLRSVRKMLYLVETLVARGHQFVVATHHPWFIEAAPEVLQCYKRATPKWVSSEKYLKSCRSVRL